MGGEWASTGDAAEFAAATRDLLAARRCELTLVSSIAHGLLDRGAVREVGEQPQLAWYRSDHAELASSRAGARGTSAVAVSAVAVQAMPALLVVSPLDGEAAVALAAYRGAPRRLLADPATASRLVAAWGLDTRVHAEERLHRLISLVEPHVAGVARVAGSADEPLVWSWQQQFHAEVAQHDPPRLRSDVQDAITAGCVVLHSVDRQPVAAATITDPLYGVSRVRNVYTPPQYRRHGYAAAATAAAVRTARQRGAEDVVLLTDLPNPTSNALYARLGFHPLLDLVQVDLLDRAPPSRGSSSALR